jgi:hypothetical protein
VKRVILGLLLSLSSAGLCFGAAAIIAQPVVHHGRAVAKPGIPSVGVPYTLGQLFNLINTANPNGTSNFILPSANNKVMTHEQCWPSRGALLDGSVSASNVNFNGVVVNKDFIQENQNLSVQLNADATLIDFLTRDNRLSPAAGISKNYAQILLYFVLAIHGTNYRFYLNDPFPGRIQGRIFPARSIMRKWNFELAFRPS